MYIEILTIIGTLLRVKEMGWIFFLMTDQFFPWLFSIAVASSDSNDTLASSSNYGECVEVIAPVSTCIAPVSTCIHIYIYMYTCIYIYIYIPWIALAPLFVHIMVEKFFFS